MIYQAVYISILRCFCCFPGGLCAYQDLPKSRNSSRFLKFCRQLGEPCFTSSDPRYQKQKLLVPRPPGQVDNGCVSIGRLGQDSKNWKVVTLQTYLLMHLPLKLLVLYLFNSMLYTKISLPPRLSVVQVMCP